MLLVGKYGCNPISQRPLDGTMRTAGMIVRGLFGDQGVKRYKNDSEVFSECGPHMKRIKTEFVDNDRRQDVQHVVFLCV